MVLPHEGAYCAHLFWYEGLLYTAFSVNFETWLMVYYHPHISKTFEDVYRETTSPPSSSLLSLHLMISLWISKAYNATQLTFEEPWYLPSFNHHQRSFGCFHDSEGQHRSRKLQGYKGTVSRVSFYTAWTGRWLSRAYKAAQITSEEPWYLPCIFERTSRNLRALLHFRRSTEIFTDTSRIQRDGVSNSILQSTMYFH